MSFLTHITPMILTYNEEANIGRCLERLVWAKEVMVIDSGSSDGTLEIIKTFPNARVLQHPFKSFAGQCEFGLANISTEWVLSLDADYILSDELCSEIAALNPRSGIAGYWARFRYCIEGNPLFGSLYPPRTVLYRKARARYQNIGHGHRVTIDGNVVTLGGKIFHDDRKDLGRWFDSQKKYAAEEAAYLSSARGSDLKAVDRIRRLIWIAPALVFVYTLLVKGTVLNGRAGWLYAYQRLIAELLLSAELLNHKIKNKPLPTTPPDQKRDQDV